MAKAQEKNGTEQVDIFAEMEALQKRLAELQNQTERVGKQKEQEKQIRSLFETLKKSVPAIPNVNVADDESVDEYRSAIQAIVEEINECNYHLNPPAKKAGGSGGSGTGGGRRPYEQAVREDFGDVALAEYNQLVSSGKKKNEALAIVKVKYKK